MYVLWNKYEYHFSWENNKDDGWHSERFKTITEDNVTEQVTTYIYDMSHIWTIDTDNKIIMFQKWMALWNWTTEISQIT
jgi:hypothetical protein